MPNDLVQINNTLSSTATDEALTAAQGKTLNDKKVTGSVGATAPTSVNFLENNAVYFQYNSTNNNAFMQQIINMVYPIGTYYWSSSSTSPQDLFGGTWTPVTDKFILAAGSTYTAGGTGGAASVTSGGTALTTNQIPAHTHGYITLTGSAMARPMSNGTSSIFLNASGILARSSGGAFNSGAVNFTTKSGTEYGLSVNASHEHASVGGGATHTHTVNTMPPYEVAYCWKRTG